MQAVRADKVAGEVPPNEPSWDRPGGLSIQERRSWATWQLATAALIFLIIGMIIGYSGKKPAKAAAAGASSGVSLDGPSGSASTVPTAKTSPSLSPGAQSVATSVNTTTTVVSASGSTANACSAPKTLLMPNTPGTGPGALASFATTGNWCIGWHFRCVLAPGGSGSFSINVVPASGASSTPTVQEAGRDVSGETPESPAGTVHLSVATDPACQWAIKVSGA
jgi:hypothetical protein